MNKICGIYKIISPSGKIYIGQAVDINRRIKEYAVGRCKNQTRLYRSIIKYGWNTHIFEIVQECNQLELNDLEIFYIKQFNTFNTEYGLNLTSGGRCGNLSDETKEKISKSHIGNKYCVGRVITEETKQKISNANKGKNCSEENKLKASILHKGNKYNLGRKVSDETRKKISEIVKGRICAEITKEKIGKSNKGKKHTEISRQKMRDAKRGYKFSQEHIKMVAEINSGYYEIYDQNNKLIYKFHSRFSTTLENYQLPVSKFQYSLRFKKKISNGDYKNWYAIRL